MGLASRHLMQLVLDAHFSQSVSRPLRSLGIDVVTLDEWHGGSRRDWPDEMILAAAYIEGRTWVTYDINSVPDLLRERAEAGLSHGGVILIQSRTVRQGDFGGQIRALRALVEQHGDEPWTDRVQYLRPA